MQKTRGVTLLELMIVSIIIAVIILLAIPYFTSLINTQRLIGTTETLYSLLQNARSEAVKRNVNVFVSFQTGTTWCYGVNSGSACNCTVPSGCNLGTVTAPNALLSLSAAGLSGSPLQFQFESVHGGASASNTLTFTLVDNTAAMNIKTGLLGNSSICSAQVSGYPTSCP